MNFSKFKRDFSYVFWTLGEQFAYLAIPRLILFPLAALIIGKNDFGIFSTAFSVTMIVGMQPQWGLAAGLLRFLSGYSVEDQKKLIGTSLKLSDKAIAFFILCGTIIALILGLVGLVPFEVIQCLVPLTLSLYPENQFLLLLTEARYKRDFKYRTLWVASRTLFSLLTGLIGAYLLGLSGLSWGILIGNSVAYLLLYKKNSDLYKTDYDNDMAILLKEVWLKITLAGILTVSIPHLNRVILSIFDSFESVSDFVAATSIAFLFLAPIQCFGILVMSLISSYRSIRDLSNKGKLYCLLMIAIGVIFIPVILLLCGKIIISGLYPDFGEKPYELLKIVMWIIPSGALISILNPFVLKFSSIRSIPIINTVTFIMTIIPSCIMIPSSGSQGAAYAMVIGNSAAAILYIGFIIRVFSKNVPFSYQGNDK